MQDLRAELEDLSFKCMHPMRAQMLENAIESSSGGRKKIVEKIRKELKSHLKTNGIENAAVKGREKIFIVSIIKLRKSINHFLKFWMFMDSEY